MKINKKLLTNLGMMAASAALGDSVSDSVEGLDTLETDDLEGLEDIDADVEDVEVDVNEDDVNVGDVQLDEATEEQLAEADHSDVSFKSNNPPNSGSDGYIYQGYSIKGCKVYRKNCHTYIWNPYENCFIKID